MINPSKSGFHVQADLRDHETEWTPRQMATNQHSQLYRHHNLYIYISLSDRAFRTLDLKLHLSHLRAGLILNIPALRNCTTQLLEAYRISQYCMTRARPVRSIGREITDHTTHEHMLQHEQHCQEDVTAACVVATLEAQPVARGTFNRVLSLCFPPRSPTRPLSWKSCIGKKTI